MVPSDAWDVVKDLTEPLFNRSVDILGYVVKRWVSLMNIQSHGYLESKHIT